MKGPERGPEFSRKNPLAARMPNGGGSRSHRPQTNQLADFLQDQPDFWRLREAHCSIRIPEGEPRSIRVGERLRRTFSLDSGERFGGSLCALLDTYPEKKLLRSGRLTALKSLTTSIISKTARWLSDPNITIYAAGHSVKQNTIPRCF